MGNNENMVWLGLAALVLLLLLLRRLAKYRAKAPPAEERERAPVAQPG